MAKATFKGFVIAESEHCENVEGNYYFPPESLVRNYFQDSSTSTRCGWKGVASYYHVVVEGQVLKNAAWYYDTPKEAAKNIAGYVAFGKAIQVLE